LLSSASCSCWLRGCNFGAQTRVSFYSKSYGILNTDCVVEFDGNHFVVDRNDVYVHNGSGSIESVATYRVKKYLFSNLNKNAIDKVHVVKDPFYKEIWINYPKGTSTVCNEALIFNYKNNTWTKRVLPSVSYAFNGPANVSNTFNYGSEVLYMCTNTNQTLVTNDGYLMWNGSALTSYTSYVERIHFNSGDVTGSVLVSSIFPVFDHVPTNASITIRTTGQNNYTDIPNLAVDDPDLKDTFIFLPNNTKSQGYKVDPRLNGRLINYRITTSDYWRLAMFLFDTKPADRR